jgi:Na+/proline symporter
MSTVDSMLLSISSSVENDVYARLRPGASDAQRARIGKRFVLVFAALLMVFAISDIGRSYIVPIGNASGSLALVLVPPLLGPLYWPRGTRAGAVAALAAGSAFMLATLVPAVRAALLPEHGLLSFSATSGLLFTAAVFVGISLITAPVPYETQVAYHGTLEKALEGVAEA